jgi:hypothetical protein
MKTRSMPRSERTTIMEHIAIDLGSRESQICLRDETGRILQEKRHATSELRHYFAMRPPGGRVVVESSAEAFTVADWAAKLGHEARVVPAAAPCRAVAFRSAPARRSCPWGRASFRAP